MGFDGSWIVKSGSGGVSWQWMCVKLSSYMYYACMVYLYLTLFEMAKLLLDFYIGVFM